MPAVNVPEDGAGDALMSTCDDEGVVECWPGGVAEEDVADEHAPAASAAHSAAEPPAAEPDHIECSGTNSTYIHPDETQEPPPALEDDSQRAEDAKILEDLQAHLPAPSESDVVGKIEMAQQNTAVKEPRWRAGGSELRSRRGRGCST